MASQGTSSDVNRLPHNPLRFTDTAIALFETAVPLSES